MVSAVALFALAGLVLDGGAALAAHGRAADVAQQAARAGADALDETSLRVRDAGRVDREPGRRPGRGAGGTGRRRRDR